VVPVVWFTLALVVALATGWPERAIAFRMWLVGVGLVGLNALVHLLGHRPTTRRVDDLDRAARAAPDAAPDVPPSFARSTRVLELVSGTAGDVHFRVRPVLREVAEHRLLTRHGLVLDDPRDGMAAADRCGPLLWDVVRPDRPEPRDRRRHELAPAAAGELVDRLEAI
jgi:hypothetical protein